MISKYYHWSVKPGEFIADQETGRIIREDWDRSVLEWYNTLLFLIEKINTKTPQIKRLYLSEDLLTIFECFACYEPLETKINKNLDVVFGKIHSITVVLRKFQKDMVILEFGDGSYSAIKVLGMPTI